MIGFLTFLSSQVEKGKILKIASELAIKITEISF